MSSPRTFDFGDLIKRADRIAAEVVHRDDITSTVTELAEAVTSQLGEQLGVTGGRVFHAEAGDDFELVRTFGAAVAPDDPPTLSRAYAPVELCCLDGVVYMDADDPRLDRALENALGAANFAAIAVGDEEFLIAFDLHGGRDREAVLVSLGILRHSLNQKIREERLDDVMRQARKIQASILPRRVPVYGDFDLAGRSDPLETVGGDFYDYIPLSDKILGIAIADVSGHGLPAALQVRDIYMGMRMGLGRDYKIVRTVERLNGIIHKSILTSRFVSMFYGELELNGNFLFVNAGHPPPFHLSATGEVTLLEAGGVVLGPVPDATYERGFVSLNPGDMLVLYTDGIVEAHCPDSEEEFGVDRLIDVAKRCRQLPAEEVVRQIFEEVSGFCVHGHASDDRTVVVVRSGSVSE